MSDINRVIIDGVPYDIGGSGSGLTEAVKEALLQIASKITYMDGDQDYYGDLYDALYPPAPPASLSRITAVFTQSGAVRNTATLDSLRPNLVVTAYYSDSTSRVITNYTLSGSLVVGTSTITANYGGKTASFNVVVTDSTVLYDVQESAFARKKSLNKYAPNYSSDNNGRISYLGFDLLLEGGKSYLIEATSTKNTAFMGVQYYNQTLLDAVNNGRDFINSDVNDLGWQSLSYTLSLPEMFNNAEVRGVRFTFKENNAGTTISDDFAITRLTIKEVQS